ncbi:MAG: hypothetical protein JEZ00_12380 [Anaerolineaceae bacterium]|nr:hypothetical protein [Anaerolineaceae bacterium]
MMTPNVQKVLMIIASRYVDVATHLSEKMIQPVWLNTGEIARQNKINPLIKKTVARKLADFTMCRMLLLRKLHAIVIDSKPIPVEMFTLRIIGSSFMIVAYMAMNIISAQKIINLRKGIFLSTKR